MIRQFILAFLCFAICVPGRAAQSASSEPVTNLRATTDLVVVDVTVADAQQNPVHHLGASDFTVTEDGHPQTIKFLEEHVPNASAPLPPLPKLDPGIFTNYSPAPATGALDILLLDKLNTPMNAQTEVRDQVLKYLKEAPPGNRIAIFALTTELKLLQGFTSDPSVLRALIEGKKGSQNASPLMDNPMSGDEPGADDVMMDAANSALGNSPNAASMLANLQQFEAEQQSLQLQLRASYTLDALNLLARYLSNLPGRKNLIWFSGSFPISILPDPSVQNPFAIVASSGDEFKETADLMARSEVAVYPIDARGLMVQPILTASNSGQSFSRTPGTFAASENQFLQQTAGEQNTMNQMAAATGGRAFVNTNDLKAAVEKAIEDGSNYYTVAYTPTNRNWNGSFRKTEVKVDRPKVVLSYRHGYFADDPNAPARHSEGQSGKNAPPTYDAKRTAMMRGAPDPTEIIFLANIRPSTADVETTVAPANEASKKLTGPYHRYTVEFRVSPKELDCEQSPDAEHHCILDFSTYLYDVDGVLLNSQNNGIKINLSPAQFASALNNYFRYRQLISVPVKGEYYLRVGLRDGVNDHLGALELPVAAVAKLKPIDADAAAPAPAASQK